MRQMCLNRHMKVVFIKVYSSLRALESFLSSEFLFPPERIHSETKSVRLFKAVADSCAFESGER